MDEIIEKLVHILKKHGAKRIEVFGSYVREKADARSDLDVIVEFEERKSLLELVGIEQKLEDRLGIKADLLTEASISLYLIDKIRESSIWMNKYDNTVFPKHILDAIDLIGSYLKGRSYEEFERNRMLQDAVIRDSEIPWRQIAGMGDKLIHGYFGVDMVAVWNTATTLHAIGAVNDGN